MAAQAAAAQAAAQAAQQVGVNSQQQQQQPGMMGMPPMQVYFKIIFGPGFANAMLMLVYFPKHSCICRYTKIAFIAKLWGLLITKKNSYCKKNTRDIFSF
jgi:hypothetical protein